MCVPHILDSVHDFYLAYHKINIKTSHKYSNNNNNNNDGCNML